MTPALLADLAGGLRKTPTSQLIAMLNPDAFVEVFRDADPGRTLTHGDVKQIAQAIADEIDRRIPVPA